LKTKKCVKFYSSHGVQKVSGLPQAAKPSFKIQISSPIEELSISQIADPLNPDAEGSFGLVNEVDISVATVTVTSAHDADIYLGSSQESYDVAPLCTFDPLAAKHNKITQLDVAIIADESKEDPKLETVVAEETTNEECNDTEEKDVEEETETVEEVKVEISTETKDTEPPIEDSTPAIENEVVSDSDDATKEPTTEEPVPTTKDQTKEEEKGEDKEPLEDSAPVATTSVITPICVVTFKIEYTPSKKEERDALYELLNTTSKKKTLALEKLRKTAAAMSQARHTTSSSALTTSSTTAGPPLTKPSTAVKSGFLNKKGATPKEPNFLMRMYNRSIGPESMFQNFFPVAKNYCVFFGAIALFHFKGHELALPPPV